ncbi:MAG: hypothetical protein C0418_00230 [Coriobacteriaceae bacterium]|nr:hypothetical protein [Coriobacteriaceae bacterium]
MEQRAAEITGVPFGGPLDAVVIGASAGGPAAVERILRALPRAFPVPLCICIHMPLGFTGTFAAHLDSFCDVCVKEARNGETLAAGTVYVAPIGRHLRLARSNGSVTARLDPDFADSLHVPSIDMLFSSAAQTYGSRLLAVLLTGMGADGALGMLAARAGAVHDRGVCRDRVPVLDAGLGRRAGRGGRELPDRRRRARHARAGGRAVLIRRGGPRPQTLSPSDW